MSRLLSADTQGPVANGWVNRGSLQLPKNSPRTVTEDKRPIADHERGTLSVATEDSSRMYYTMLTSPC